MKKRLAANPSPLITAPTALAAGIALALNGEAFGAEWKTNPQVFYTAGSERWYSGGALLIPLVQRDFKMAYMDLRFARGRHGSREINAGYGRRRLLGEGILGSYLSFDRRSTSNRNSFEQFTFGLEWLTNSLDFNANFYHVLSNEEIDERFKFDSATAITSSSESVDDNGVFSGTELLVTTTTTTRTTTTETFSSQSEVEYEEALSGFDLEAGYLLPFWRQFETRLYLSAFDFNSRYTSDDVTGTALRLEFRPMRSLRVEAKYKDDDIFGAQVFGSVHYYPGFKNKSGQRSLRERMTEFHQRDIDVVTVTNKGSDAVLTHIPFLDARILSEASLDTVDTFSTELRPRDMDDDGIPDVVMHIDNTAHEAVADGSSLKPFISFEQCDVDCTSADIIYVHAGNSRKPDKAYNTSGIELEDNQMLAGEGADFFGILADKMPVVLNSANNDSLVTLADNNEVQGLELRVAGDNTTADISAISGHNVKNPRIHDNKIIGNAGNSLVTVTHGLTLTYDTFVDGENFNAWIDNNIILSHSGHGVLIRNDFKDDGSVSQVISLTGNIIKGNESYGILLDSDILNAEAAIEQSVDLTATEIMYNTNGISNYVDIVLDTAGADAVSVIQDFNLYDAAFKANENHAFKSTIFSDITAAEPGFDLNLSHTVAGNSVTRFLENSGSAFYFSSTVSMPDINFATVTLANETNFSGSRFEGNSGGLRLINTVTGSGSYNQFVIDQNTNLDNLFVTSSGSGISSLFDFTAGYGSHNSLVFNRSDYLSNIELSGNSEGVLLESSVYTNSAVSDSFNSVSVSVNAVIDSSSIYNISAGSGINQRLSVKQLSGEQVDIAVNHSATVRGSVVDDVNLTGVYISDEVEFSGMDNSQVNHSANFMLDQADILNVYRGVQLSSIFSGYANNSTINRSLNQTVSASQIQSSNGEGVGILQKEDISAGVNSTFTNTTTTTLSEIDIFGHGATGVAVLEDHSFASLDQASVTIDSNLTFSYIDVDTATGINAAGIDITLNSSMYDLDTSTVNEVRNLSLDNISIADSQQGGLFIDIYNGVTGFGNDSSVSANTYVALNNVLVSNALDDGGLNLASNVVVENISAALIDIGQDANLSGISIDGSGGHGIHINQNSTLDSVLNSTVDITTNFDSLNLLTENNDSSSRVGMEVNQQGSVLGGSNNNITFNQYLSINDLVSNYNHINLAITQTHSFNDLVLTDVNAYSTLNLNTIDLNTPFSPADDGLSISQVAFVDGSDNSILNNGVIHIENSMTLADVVLDDAGSRGLYILQGAAIKDSNFASVSLDNNSNLQNIVVNNSGGKGIEVWQGGYISDFNKVTLNASRNIQLTNTWVNGAGEEGILLRNLSFISSVYESSLDISSLAELNNVYLRNTNDAGLTLYTHVDGHDIYWSDLSLSHSRQLTGIDAAVSGNQGVYLNNIYLLDSWYNSSLTLYRNIYLANSSITTSSNAAIDISGLVNIGSPSVYDRYNSFDFNQYLNLYNNQLDGESGIQLNRNINVLALNYGVDLNVQDHIRVMNNTVAAGSTYGLLDVSGFYMAPDIYNTTVNIAQYREFSDNTFSYLSMTGINVNHSIDIGNYQNNSSVYIMDNIAITGVQALDHNGGNGIQIRSASYVANTIAGNTNTVDLQSSINITDANVSYNSINGVYIKLMNTGGYYNGASFQTVQHDIYINNIQGSYNSVNGVYIKAMADAIAGGGLDLTLNGSYLNDNSGTGLKLYNQMINIDNAPLYQVMNITNNFIKRNDSGISLYIAGSGNTYNDVVLNLDGNSITNSNLFGIYLQQGAGVNLQGNLKDNSFDGGDVGIYAFINSAGLNSTQTIDAYQGGNSFDNFVNAGFAAGIFAGTQVVDLEAGISYLDNTFSGNGTDISVYYSAGTQTITDHNGLPVP